MGKTRKRILEKSAISHISYLISRIYCIFPQFVLTLVYLCKKGEIHYG